MINPKMLMCAAMITVLIIGCAPDHSKKTGMDMKTMTEPKVGMDTARQTVVAKYPTGVVNAGKMEEWKGKMFWMFDITTAGTPNITEVAVDQQSGKIVWTNTQTPEERAKEEAEEKNEK